jgi:hypothetical protein
MPIWAELEELCNTRTTVADKPTNKSKRNSLNFYSKMVMLDFLNWVQNYLIATRTVPVPALHSL